MSEFIGLLCFSRILFIKLSEAPLPLTVILLISLVHINSLFGCSKELAASSQRPAASRQQLFPTPMINIIFLIDIYGQKLTMKKNTISAFILALLLIGCNQTESNQNAANQDTLVNVAADSVQTIADNEYTNNLDETKGNHVNYLVGLFQEYDFETISTLIQYPLERQYPIPSIKDKKEFMQRYSEVFDETIVLKIQGSTPGQWQEVGWRGIMFNDGELWLGNSDSIITAVNYQSDYEKKYLADLIKNEKSNLHVSLKTFEKPVFTVKTQTTLIRVDQLTNEVYRFASWKKGKNESAKPDLVLSNGKIAYDGSGGNYSISFIDGVTTYRVYRNIIGEDKMADVSFEIEKNGQQIVTEQGNILLD